MNPASILVAGGAVNIRRDLRAALECERHKVTEVDTADQTIHETCSEQHDLVIIASELKGIESYELCRTIRSKSNLGIVVLGEANAATKSVDALNAGADDYIPAPWVFPELLARVRAILRRVSGVSDDREPIVLQDRAIDLKSHRIKGPGEREIHLTPKEFLVLKHLLDNANKSLTHQSLAQSVWQRDAKGEIEYVRIVIKQLRRKLEPDPDNPRYIRTERSVGYWFHMPQIQVNRSRRPDPVRRLDKKTARPPVHPLRFSSSAAS